MIWYAIAWTLTTIALATWLYHKGHEDGWIEGYITAEANQPDFLDEVTRKLDDIDIELSELITSHDEVTRELSYR